MVCVIPSTEGGKGFTFEGVVSAGTMENGSSVTGAAAGSGSIDVVEGTASGSISGRRGTPNFLVSDPEILLSLESADRVQVKLELYALPAEL